ncbi:hypothetical protein N6G02_19425 [Cupriavidus gilardii]|uniref:Uncharacterized protein n=1 Tax=Cupriavidus gilardii TaxID=82541 RepID=A0ABY4VNG8_9BURK|nr:hypothetical protein [Cupriavidus gilardii]MCT9118318.1 hypothetical protein [Cupriavidus gilardii]USE78712.1 hypothetical protein NDR89_18865 [Cupriavidus gilardii]
MAFPLDTSSETESSVEDLESMLADDEALEGIEAWLSRQQLTIHAGPRGQDLAGGATIETSAGWLLRLVRHARSALAAPKQGRSVASVR